MKTKILITGSNGLLGQNLIELFLKDENSYEIVGFSRGENRSGRKEFEYLNIDITNKNLLIEKTIQINPDFIINTAAMTNVDACENDKKGCFDLNVNVVQNLTDIC